MPKKSAEQDRLEEPVTGPVSPWLKWGSFVAERAWGTVREDYSADGNAWVYFPYDAAYAKAYRWGEDAIAGWCDRYQILIFGAAFWNGADPYLKERLFGLSSPEGNHGEDVKEYYFYLDGMPTNSYMKFLYKYPQREYPYQQLRDANQGRPTNEGEYELVDTGIFSENRYFDIFVEYAKVTPEDVCIRIEAHNRSDAAAPLHIIPQLWFRNQWSWPDIPLSKPQIVNHGEKSFLCLEADDSNLPSPSNLSFDYHLGKRYFYAPLDGKPLFTENETRYSENDQGFFKDAFHRSIIRKQNVINPKEIGTKAAIHYEFPKVPAHGKVTLIFRMSNRKLENPLEEAIPVFEQRKAEADEFYEQVLTKGASAEEKRIQRLALASILWSKQIYLFDVDLWLKGDNSYHPPPPERYQIRNMHWEHLNSMRLFNMPDMWEYPYFCAWDQAFHSLPLALVDIEQAKEQLWLLLFDQFQHPNGQVPACEWEFSDLNPPVQAWAALHLYNMEKERHGKADRDFLMRCFHKMLMNFSWWVNKVDSLGNNVFEGGFLGLDNITVWDRSLKLPGGVILQQSDGTGWMAMFCLNLMRIALELAKEQKVYESLATKFFQHYVYIAHALKRRGNQEYEMWSDNDHFFYDVVSYPDGTFAKFRVRSLVGIIPLYAVDILQDSELKQFAEFNRNFEWFLANRSKLVEDCITVVEKDGKKSYVLALMNKDHLQSVIEYVWNPQEFRSPYGLRSLSLFHEKQPFVFQDRKVEYEPGLSTQKIKGGNSNWRGPVWFPTTYLLIESLKKFSSAFGEDWKIQVGGEPPVDLATIAESFADRLIDLFKKGKNGRPPFWGNDFPFKDDPHWKNLIFFHEFFHSETGQGLGAQHQGWTSLVANLIDEFRKNTETT